MCQDDLERMRDWAIERLTTGNEPPWSWYQLMKLREATEAILAGMAATRPMADLPVSAARQDAGLRLVASGCSPDSVPHHLDTLSVQLPM